MVVALLATHGVEVAQLSQRHFLGYEYYNADNEVHTLSHGGAPPVAASLRCITFLTVLFFSVYLVVIFVRSCRKLAACTHQIILPLLVTAADALDLVPMLCILMINARQRATQLNPAVGDPQPWAQTCMYACVASLVLRLILIVAEEAVASSKGEEGGKLWGVHTAKGEDKERECDQPACAQQLSPLDKALLAGHVLASLSLYGCCAAIIVSTFIMKRPFNLETPPLTPMTLCSTLLTILYLLQYLVIEISGFSCGTRSGRWSSNEQDSPTMLSGPYGDATPVIPHRGRPEDAAFIKIEPVTLQFIPMFCVLLVGISLRAVQLNLQPDKWACAAMILTTVAIVIQAMAVPVFKYFLSPGDLGDVAQAEEDASCIPASRKSEEESSSVLPMKILVFSWSLLMICLYVGIAGTLVTVFAMEDEPLDVVWPEEKQLGLFLRHLEKSRHLMENEALTALYTASLPPISTAMKCTMLLTVLYFGVFLGVLVGRATCGPARKQAACVNQAEDELWDAVQTLDSAQQGLDEKPGSDPELGDVTHENESRILDQLKQQVQKAKEGVRELREELVRAQEAENQVRDGIQRSLAFVPMLCVLMIAVRMRAIQIHIRDPQPWAQITMYVASAAVTTQVLASILWACCVKADDIALSCGEVGLCGKVSAILILVVRYVAALVLYVAMIALVVALTSMQQGISVAY